ncbi:MAG: hypothetical protein M1825_002777 [Sarcosagium campestre]|nr:MAG: hypothetical protein M1825_002777 [Sarcosagium campestre]
MAASESSRPSQLTGGCLCGAVRYSVGVGSDDAWPPKTTTCQCTQCRKNTGALVAHLIPFAASRITWGKPSASFQEYNSSPGCYRGFCRNCGSTLTWRGENSPDERGQIELHTGSLDEQYLVDTTASAGQGDAKKGGVSKNGGWGVDLAGRNAYNVYFQNAIRGVTDGSITNGKRFVESSTGGEM